MTFDFDESETFERELFATRAVPTMKLDVEEVFARTPREEKMRTRATWPSWVGAVACAAASVIATQAHTSTHDAVIDSYEDASNYSDGLSCRSDVSETSTNPNADTAMCFAAPSTLVCERDVTSSIQKP